MIVLGIETATTVCSVGLAGDEGLIAEQRLVRKHSHAEVLSDMVNWICANAEIQLKTLDGVAISNGPGSFTGLRIGLGFAKGLVFGAELNLIAVSTLEALIRPVLPVCTQACVLLTSRKGEAYRGVFQWCENRWIPGQADGIVDENNIFNGLGEEKILFIGSGSRQFKEILERDHRTVLLTEEYDNPSGFSVAALGRDKLAAGEYTDPDEAIPEYLNRFQGVA